jgi:hypothetical protein
MPPATLSIAWKELLPTTFLERGRFAGMRDFATAACWERRRA